MPFISGEQGNTHDGNRGTKAILRNKEHEKIEILILWNKGYFRFFFQGNLMQAGLKFAQIRKYTCLGTSHLPYLTTI